MKVVDHQPGHVGCCPEGGDGTMGFTYVPGRAAPQSEVYNAQLKGKRNLSVDEFEHYYRMLGVAEYSNEAKIAIAMVLKGDMVRLYKNTPNYRVDDYLQLWVDKYNTLSEASKQVVNGEVAAFDQFLMTSKLEDFYPPNMIPFINAAREYEINANQHSIEMEAALKQAEDEKKRQIEYVRFQAMEDLKKRMAEFDMTMTPDQERFIKQNFADYLKAIETDQYANMALDQAKNEAKEAAYAEILGKFNRGEINYETAMDMYATELAEINKVNVSSLVFRKDFNHPILKYVSTKK